MLFRSVPAGCTVLYLLAVLYGTCRLYSIVQFVSSLTLLLLSWILLDSAPEVPRGRPSRQRDPLDSSSDRGRPLYPSPPTRDPEHEVQPFTTVPPVNGPDHRYLPGGPFLPDHLLRREFQGDQRFFSENAAAPLAARTTVPGSRAVPGDAGDGAREAEEVPAFSDVASPATTTPAPTSSASALYCV